MITDLWGVTTES